MTLAPMPAGALLLLLLAAPAFAQASGNLVEGRKLAAEHCARCHAIGGAGPSPLATAPPFSRLHKTSRRRNWRPSSKAAG